MPMHDWTKVDAGIYHVQHMAWILQLMQSLNRTLPSNYYALAEQYAGDVIPDVIALERSHKKGGDEPKVGNGVAVLPRPLTRFVVESPEDVYVQKQSRIAIRHVSGDELVAVIEVLSPGNKSSERAMRQLLDKTEELLEQRIHLLVIDPFPPTSRDPQGIHAAIWNDRTPGAFQFDPQKPLTLVSYECAVATRAYVEPLAVGDTIRSMPVYLERDLYVDAPLEETYQAAFAALPDRWREVLNEQS